MDQGHLRRQWRESGIAGDGAFRVDREVYIPEPNYTVPTDLRISNSYYWLSPQIGPCSQQVGSELYYYTFIYLN